MYFLLQIINYVFREVFSTIKFVPLSVLKSVRSRTIINSNGTITRFTVILRLSRNTGKLIVCTRPLLTKKGAKVICEMDAREGNRLEVRFVEQIDLSRRKFTAWCVINKSRGRVSIVL